MFGFRSRNRKQEDNPADYVFKVGYSPHGSFLFEDGTFGYIGDPQSDIKEFLEDDDWETAESIEEYYYGISDRERRAEAKMLICERFGGKIPIGN